MAKSLPDVSLLLETMERAVADPAGSRSLPGLLRALTCLKKLREIIRRNPTAVEPVKERLLTAKTRLIQSLTPHRDQLTNDAFGLKAEIEALKHRLEQNSDALKEIFKAQTESKYRIPVPLFEGTLIAYERNTLLLPTQASNERSRLEELLRSKPEYWIEASALHGGKIKLLCDRLKTQDSVTAEALRRLLVPVRDFVLLFRSPQFKSGGDVTELH